MKYWTLMNRLPRPESSKDCWRIFLRHVGNRDHVAGGKTMNFYCGCLLKEWSLRPSSVNSWFPWMENIQKLPISNASILLGRSSKQSTLLGTSLIQSLCLSRECSLQACWKPSFRQPFPHIPTELPTEVGLQTELPLGKALAKRTGCNDHPRHSWRFVSVIFKCTGGNSVV